MKLQAGFIDVEMSLSPILTSFPSPTTHTTTINKKLTVIDSQSLQQEAGDSHGSTDFQLL
jgi:hypothetical protein